MLLSQVCDIISSVSLSSCCVVRLEVPTDVTGIVMLIHFLVAVYISGRFDERIQRLQFLWTQEVRNTSAQFVYVPCSSFREKLLLDGSKKSVSGVSLNKHITHQHTFSSTLIFY